MAGGPLAGLLKDLEADCFASSEQRVLAAFVVGWGAGVLHGAGWHDQRVAAPHASVAGSTHVCPPGPLCR